MKAKLKEMLHWGKLIFNYHPDWLPKEVNTLNKVLGFKYEFTPTLLTEPANPQETALIVARLFDRAISPTDKKDEAVVDRIGLEHHQLSGRAKDIGSAAVFISLVNVVAVWLRVLAPRSW